MGSTISYSRTLIPIIGQNLNGSIDNVFAYHKETENNLEGVLSSTPATGFENRRRLFLYHISVPMMLGGHMHWINNSVRLCLC